MDDEQIEYPSFNGLSRVALFWGVPLMAIVIIVIASLVIAIVATLFLGPGGLFFGAVGIPILFYLKHICENDDQAARIVFLELRCWLSRRNAKSFGDTYTLSPMQYDRRSHVYKRYFKKSTIE